LAAIAPGLIQDFQGQIKSDLQVTGSWEDPVFSGRMSLTDAGAYLPSTGVTLENLRLRLAMQEDKIRIEEFSVQSGPGTMSGTGELDFDRWQLEEYQMTVEGDRFQLYDFPELKLLCSPKLSLSGGSESVQLRGSVLIPEMSLRGSSTVPKSLPNSDVVISGVVHDERKVLPVNADIQVTVELGGQVWVKTAGVNTRLKGGGTITLDEQNHLATRGEIHLVEGVYKAYGANLDIKQGLLKYKGGQITNPELRIFAARDIGLVQAGVQITGTAEAPVVTLYSRPAMPERDVLSYIFMGRPMRIDQEGEDGLMIGASTLIPGYGNAFSDLGITEIDVQGMFEGDGGVRMRKRLTERWEVRSTFGSENGVDLYYIFKFD
ncbi:MAG: translocation/assembly module TamB domain-containing protein, partial [Desulfuromonadales bacterium]|nr:translocation/assembly module TamB domain-containing protein [Desulfuromonadales bacterium]